MEVRTVFGRSTAVFAHRIIVGASGSPGSIPALRYAGTVARRDDAPLIAVHAWLPPGGDLADRRTPSPYLRRLWAEAAAARLRDALDAAWGGVPLGLEVHTRVVRGEPGPVLVDTAASADDLLVVGAGQRGWPGRLWRGKVSRFCVARAACPVLAVPPAAAPQRRGGGPGYWSLRHGQLTVEQAVRDWEHEDLGRL
jgi:nucleotide-binding universal stress UspA family protein